MLENTFEKQISSKISLTPTDVLTWPAMQNTRDGTICKEHTDEKTNFDFIH